MPLRALETEVPLPRWLIVVGSLVLVVHWLAVAALVLGAPSGPWISPMGASPAAPPQFTRVPLDLAVRYYFQPLRMTHNYHFVTNHPGRPGVFFEVRLKDGSGKDLGAVRFPDANAPAGVRHRQDLLARALADDQPVPPPAVEVVAAPQQQMRMVPIWEPTAPRTLQLRSVPEHLVPRDRPVFRASDWSLLLARAYVRHACRTHGAASAEVIRHTQEPISPTLLLAGTVPAGGFEELIAHFGEVSP